MANISVNMPTAKELADYHKRYEEEVCTHFVYRLATEEMRAGRSAEGIMLLLIAWNRLNLAKFDPVHLRRVLHENRPTIAEFAGRSISGMNDTDQSAVRGLFQAFDDVPDIGATGAAKSIHLLAPDFLPLWDTKIAEVYSSHDVEGYWKFMKKTKTQYQNIMPDPPLCVDDVGHHVGLLKLLDEYNYCKYKLDVI